MGSAVSVTLRPRFTPGKWNPVPTGWEVGRASELVRTQRLEEKSSWFCRGMNPGRPVCSQTLHWLSYPSSENPIFLRFVLPALSFGKCINLRQREHFFELLWTLNIGGPRHSPSAPMPNRANSNYHSRHLTRLVFKSRSFVLKLQTPVSLHGAKFFGIWL
jgi:hypothetical protein